MIAFLLAILLGPAAQASPEINSPLELCRVVHTMPDLQPPAKRYCDKLMEKAAKKEARAAKKKAKAEKKQQRQQAQE